MVPARPDVSSDSGSVESVVVPARPDVSSDNGSVESVEESEPPSSRAVEDSVELSAAACSEAVNCVATFEVMAAD